jgi:drug/metabolite transporter (DMT)-like permease
VSRSAKAHILLVLVTLVWGATFVVIKDALADISPLLFNAVRMTLAAVTLALVYARHLRRLTRGALLGGILIGALLWLSYEFQTTGLGITTASKSAFITGFSVILVPVFLFAWHKRINRWTLVGVLIAFTGLYLMTVPAGLDSINRGDVLTIVAAVIFALQIICVGRIMRHHPFELVATVEIAVAAALMFLSVPLVEHAYVIWSSRVIVALLVTFLLGTAAAFVIQAWAQQFIPPTHTALIFLLEPVFAWVTSYLVLHERLGLRAGLGAALILGGILVSELKGSPSHPETEVEEPAAI